MPNLEIKEPKGTSDKFRLNLTLCLFFLLPRKVSTMFVSLSVSMLVLKLRGLLTGSTRVDKLRKLLASNYDEEAMYLPRYTLKWFWPDDYLDSLIELDNKRLTIREAIGSRYTIRNHCELIATAMVANLPYLIKLKLEMFDKKGLDKMKLQVQQVLEREISVV